MTVAIELALMAVLFALSAFFSGSETILFSLTALQRSRIKSRDPAAERRIAKCMDDSASLLSTLLVGNTLVNFALATIGYRLFAEAWPRWGALAAVPAMTVALLLLGEITPKRLALRYAESLAPACARLLLFWRAVFAPFNHLFRFGARAFAPALKRERRALSDAELVSVLESAAEHGEFASADAEMIEGVLRLSELCANDEMTPRVDIEGIDSDSDEATQAAARAAAHHDYLPVYRRSRDAIEGVIERSSGKLFEPLYVPEQITLDDLLVVFRKSGRPLAVVLDEYGGTAGIITLDDILELIVGPQVFSHPDREPQIVKVGDDAWEIDARASLDEVNRELDVELEADDADRLSGWIAFHTERVPSVGQKIVADRCAVTVLRRRPHAVSRVRLEVLERSKPSNDAALIAETDEAVAKTEADEG